MFFRKSILPLAAVMLLSASSAFAQTTTTSATRSFDYPPVGLASSETMQINVLNRATASSSGTAASCTGTISFTSATGAALGTATSFTVTSGEIFSATLESAATGTRTEVVGIVSVTTTSGTPCALRTSLETFDTATGVTHVYLAGFGGGPGGPGGHPGH